MIKHQRVATLTRDSRRRGLQRDLLVQALQAERLRLRDAEQEIAELRAKAAALERSVLLERSAAGSPAVAMADTSGQIDQTSAAAAARPLSSTSTDLSDLLRMARSVRTRVRVLHRLLQSYIETDAIDMELLASESWRGESARAHEAIELLAQQTPDASESASESLRGELLQTKRSLAELQQLVEDACATAMGSSCALQ